jgi:elongator complex protein 1
VVSALSSKCPLSGLRKRVLRVYNRDTVLQSTSEAVAGLEHSLSWRPSGNLIVSTQRFGFEGGGEGKDGRHDVVFFERNGLRHGEFTLREPWRKTVSDGRINWGYSVEDVAWSSDSNILSIWVKGQEKDVGSSRVHYPSFFRTQVSTVQLWTTGNYHWCEFTKLVLHCTHIDGSGRYLKQEIESSAGERFTRVLWHPEDSSKLILATSCTHLFFLAPDVFLMLCLSPVMPTDI